MRTRTTLTAAAALMLATLTACGGSDDTKADPHACKKALYNQYRDTVAAGDDAPKGKKPAACTGVDNATLERLAGEVVKEYLESDDAEKALDDAVKDAISDAPFDEVTPAPAASQDEKLDDIQKELDDLMKDIEDAKTP